jgi:AbrB family looped-hinge helix DNA binding protein
MSETIQVIVDDQGRIIIPSTIREQLGLSQGMTLVVEEGEEDELCLRVQERSPDLVDKQGVLVVRAEPLGDLTHVTQRERLHRASDLVQRVGL